MDADVRDLQNLEVENVDETYYGEVIGCKVNVEGAGRCARFDCGEGDIRVCQKPRENKARKYAELAAELDGPC